jgi:outer membrane protein assembly factor BamB
MKMRTLFLCLCLFPLALPALAADWPQWQGPDRTNLSKQTGLLKAWPKKGPPLLWTFEKTGIGFSGPAIVGDRLYIMGARKDGSGQEVEYLLALDVNKKGKEVWSAKIGPIFTFKGNTWGDGPRGTPTVDGDRIYALGGQGILICVSAAKGQELWRKDLPRELNGQTMELWGYCESPLIDGNQLVCSPGGPDGTLAALDKKNGKVLWRTKDLKDQATYGSMVAAELGGVKQYIQTTYLGRGKGGQIVGVEARTGKVLWSQPQPKYDMAIASTPVLSQDQVYVSAGYGAGCNLLQITGSAAKGFKPKELFNTAARKVLKNNHEGLVLLGGHVYGYTENTGWVCQDLKTGKAAWLERRKLKGGSLTCAGGRLYLYGEEDGTVVLLEPNPKGWKEHGRFEIPQQSQVPEKRRTSSQAKIWTHPVVANGRLYLRDQEYLFCYDVREK